MYLMLQNFDKQKYYYSSYRPTSPQRTTKENLMSKVNFYNSIIGI